jgi:hypothetical protein
MKIKELNEKLSALIDVDPDAAEVQVCMYSYNENGQRILINDAEQLIVPISGADVARLTATNCETNETQEIRILILRNETDEQLDEMRRMHEEAKAKAEAAEAGLKPACECEGECKHDTCECDHDACVKPGNPEDFEACVKPCDCDHVG